MPSWIAKNAYLTETEMQHNAINVIAFFRGQGWTDNAIAAILGNMQGESQINPGLWESLQPYAGGYGLVQWTPYTDYSNWAGPGWENNGDRQLECIMHEYRDGGQWYPTATYPMSWDTWAHTAGDPGDMAYAFMYNYERPATLNHPERKEYAKIWFDFIVHGGGVIPPAPGKIPIWLIIAKLRGII